MSIDTNQELIQAYIIAHGPTEYARYVKKQILEVGKDLPSYHAQHGTLRGSGLRLRKEVLGVLEQLLSGQLDPNQVRMERHANEDAELGTLSRMVQRSRADRHGRINPSIDHKK